MIKKIYSDLKEWWNDNPWEFIGNFLFVLLIFTLFYGAMLLNAVATGTW